MNRQKWNLRILGVGILVMGVICIMLQPKPTDGRARVTMLDVGQGDSFLVQGAHGTQMLIDGGKDGTVLAELARVMPRGDRSIDVVLATHPDADHIGGLSQVLERYDVGMFLTTQVATDTDVYRSLREVLAAKQIPAYYVRRGMTLILDHTVPTTFAVLFPDRDTSGWETNSASVVGRLEVGERSMFLGGDAPLSVEDTLARTFPKLIDVDVLKLSHHGSKTSTSDAFLRATTPALALVSAGAGNRYGHPASEVTDRLKKLGIKTLSTIQEGSVTLSSDGMKWFVEK